MGVHVSPRPKPHLTPPSPSHPSGLSQWIGCDCPVPCIELGLVIYFTDGNIHVSMLFSSCPTLAFSDRHAVLKDGFNMSQCSWSLGVKGRLAEHRSLSYWHVLAASEYHTFMPVPDKSSSWTLRCKSSRYVAGGPRHFGLKPLCILENWAPQRAFVYGCVFFPCKTETFKQY